MKNSKMALFIMALISVGSGCASTQYRDIIREEAFICIPDEPANDNIRSFSEESEIMDLKKCDKTKDVRDPYLFHRLNEWERDYLAPMPD